MRYVVPSLLASFIASVSPLTAMASPTKPVLKPVDRIEALELHKRKQKTCYEIPEVSKHFIQTFCSYSLANNIVDALGHPRFQSPFKDSLHTLSDSQMKVAILAYAFEQQKYFADVFLPNSRLEALLEKFIEQDITPDELDELFLSYHQHPLTQKLIEEVTLVSIVDDALRGRDVSPEDRQAAVDRLSAREEDIRIRLSHSWLFLSMQGPDGVDRYNENMFEIHLMAQRAILDATNPLVHPPEFPNP